MNYAVTVSIRDTHRWLVEKRTVAIEATNIGIAAKKGYQAVKATVKGKTQVKEAIVRVLWVRPGGNGDDE